MVKLFDNSQKGWFESCLPHRVDKNYTQYHRSIFPMWIVKKDNPLYRDGFDAEKFYAPILKHITDSRLRKLYFDIWNDPYSALREGDRLLVDSLDKYSILSPMWEAVQNIILDLEENPDHALGKYAGHGVPFFIDARNRIEHEMEILKNNGFKNSVFEKYEKKFNAELKKLVAKDQE